MACYSPLQAYRVEGETKLRFEDNGRSVASLMLPCGRCIGCRLKRSLAWTIRNVHESQMHERSLFVTLTYNDENVKPSLYYRDFQLFMKRLRKRGRCRFFCVGEYGESDAGDNGIINRYAKLLTGLETTLKRPHFHALLYGVDFGDRKKIGLNGDGSTLWRSPTLEKLWTAGNSSFGDVTFASAAYCARYCVEKVNGDLANDHYSRVDVDTGEVHVVARECAHMSLRPAIGVPWLAKYGSDIVAARDGVVLNGKTFALPRFYDRVVESLVPDIHSDKEFDRYVLSEKFKEDCTPERLAVREKVALARLNFKKVI